MTTPDKGKRPPIQRPRIQRMVAVVLVSALLRGLSTLLGGGLFRLLSNLGLLGLGLRSDPGLFALLHRLLPVCHTQKRDDGVMHRFALLQMPADHLAPEQIIFSNQPSLNR